MPAGLFAFTWAATQSHVVVCRNMKCGFLNHVTDCASLSSQVCKKLSVFRGQKKWRGHGRGLCKKRAVFVDKTSHSEIEVKFFL